MQIDFTDKPVLVTGGTRGIGRRIVAAFLGAGARVALNGSSVDGTAAALAEIDAGDRVVAAPGSVATVDGCRDVDEAAAAGLGGLDVLVNNAGRRSGAPAFIVAEIVGAVAATLVFRWLLAGRQPGDSEPTH